jgi:hypothetical protein
MEATFLRPIMASLQGIAEKAQRTAERRLEMPANDRRMLLPQDVTRLQDYIFSNAMHP